MNAEGKTEWNIKFPKENENESKEDGMWLLCKYGIQEMPWMETE